MYKRTCKTCGIEKHYKYLALDNRSRSVYKDETGKLWHGKKCGDCQLTEVKRILDKQPLSESVCKVCSKEFKKKAIKQIVCSLACYKILRKS